VALERRSTVPYLYSGLSYYFSIPNILASGTTYHDAATLPPIECHAVRHLYFLLHTDEEIAGAPVDKFWDFAHQVVDIHHPAVAGFVGLNPH
jgi:hypothetical protein